MFGLALGVVAFLCQYQNRHTHTHSLSRLYIRQSPVRTCCTQSLARSATHSSIRREGRDTEAASLCGHDGQSVVHVLHSSRDICRLLAPMLDRRLHVPRLDLALPLALRKVIRSDDLDRTRRRVARGARAGGP